MMLWDYARNVFENESVKLAIEDESDWTNPALQESELNSVKIQWHSIAPGSGAPVSLIAGAITSVNNMGRDTSKAEDLFWKGMEAYKSEDYRQLFKLTAAIYQTLEHAQKISGHQYHKYCYYETEDDFRKKINPIYQKKNVSNLSELIYSAWLGQIAAGAFGTAIEGYSGKEIRKRFPRIRGFLKKPSLYNDDITFQLALLQTVLDKGRNLTSNDIALNWVAMIPFGWSAENIALNNLKLGLKPPESGLVCNPFREWIGAQMRAPICGYLAAGDPELASHLAWQDAVISHSNNGILGEVYNAVMTSLAFIDSDLRRVLKKSVEWIPLDSEFYAVISEVLQLCESNNNPYEVLAICDRRFRRFDLVHAYPNMAIQIIALWYCDGDFTRSMELTAHGGLDVDSNAGQIGSMLGIITKGQIGDSWINDIGTELKTYVRGFESLSIRKLSELTIQAQRMLQQE